MDDTTPDHKIDITNDVCPMTFVRTRLKLETMTRGQILEVTLGAGEPLKNVPRSVTEMGDTVIDIVELANAPETYRLTIRKG
ncbi:sulfurtransferase TusA family protein [Thalassospira xianhensis]|uniref:Preprotein translocase subunit TatB n=1 Tax=Thalassospira xianhensis MCCC 1A02616 TaxID=1177929 RepID=A0A367UFZ1_9PROT|nr:sulfurtransferase TusA family protein [Thalassospira xianhensis]RCK07225.1 preprotein translocase subunit TatB [Thalassospira xianhensis MCCC 1A02616]UKV14606.1 sulfurtransferase TusA family protein [Thalassospiraceae bacterium SW-3-3]